MRLAQALRLEDPRDQQAFPPRLALTGAGGKTTALFQLARQLLDCGRGAQAVIVTTTTHLGVEQAARADLHFLLTEPAELHEWVVHLPAGVLLLSGEPTKDGKLRGLSTPLLDDLRRSADRLGLPLLIEADGSRRLPLKAPAEHEPVVPDWVDTVLVTAGLSGLGQPLDAAHVHRPERFAALAGLALGDPVTAGALSRVLSNRDGGLKGLPVGARRALLLNQADTPERVQAARWIARQLEGFFNPVIMASLQPEEIASGTLPVPGVVSTIEPTAGILLAAGASTRLGQPKQLLDWQGEPFVRRVARTGLAAGLSPLVVVTGAQAEGIIHALEGLPVVFAHNPEWPAGQSSSIQAGLRALSAETGSVIFLLSDQPQIPAALLRRLVDMHESSLASLLAPQVNGRRANPVLFDRRTFSSLFKLQGDVGGRAIFAQFDLQLLEWEDPTLLLDVDTPEDYQRLKDA